MMRRVTRRRTSGPAAPAAGKRFDKWIVIGPGGGGAQYIPTVSPHDPNKVFVRCDMTGSYLSEDGGKSWRMLNLHGVVRFFVFDPVDPDTMYAQSSALYRSRDGGRTWELVHPAPSDVKGIEMPDDHARVDIVTTSRPRESVLALAVDPAASRILYAVITRDGAAAFCISRDRGKTWQQGAPAKGGSWTRPDQSRGRALRIYVDPASPKRNRTIYIVGACSVSVLENGKWTHHKKAPTEGFVDVSAGFAEEGGRPIIYAACPAKWRGKRLSGGVIVSFDGGKTWRQVLGDLARQAAGSSPNSNIRGIAACLTRPEVAYIGYKNFRLGRVKTEFFGCAKTVDAGKTWQVVWKETETAKSAPNMNDAWLSARFGPIWGDAPRYLGVDPKNPNVCFTTDDGRTMCTKDGGGTWRACYSAKRGSGWTTKGLDVLTCYGVHFDPFDRRRVFISYTDIGLMASDDGGATWTSATAKGVPRHWTNTTYWLEFDPKVKGRAWAVFSANHDLPRPKMWRRGSPSRYTGGVCTSLDGGRTWKRTTKGMPETACTQILLDPKSPVDSRTLYVCGYGTGVWKSTDGGRSWKKKNSGLPKHEPFAWRIARDRNGVLYLVVARRSDDGSYGDRNDGALYRSRDAAESWERIRLPRGVNGPNDIAIDPKDPNRLYLAAWGRDMDTKAVDGGIWLSTDAGKTWKNVLSKDQHVYAMTIDPKNRKVVYATGFESTVHRSDDAGATWKRVRGFNFKWGHRVTPDPYDRSMIFVSTFGGSVWYGPAKGDGKAVEDIVTPVVRYSSMRFPRRRRAGGAQSR